MTLQEALDKIETLQHLIGKQLRGYGDIPVELLMPAPTNEKLTGKFVFMAKQGELDYDEIAALLGVSDFDILVLHEGSINTEDGYESGDIIESWLKDYPEIV